MKIEIDLPDEDFEKLNNIYRNLNRCLKKDLQNVLIQFVKDNLNEIDAIL
jgi:hypothetical protein